MDNFVRREVGQTGVTVSEIKELVVNFRRAGLVDEAGKLEQAVTDLQSAEDRIYTIITVAEAKLEPDLDW